LPLSREWVDDADSLPYNLDTLTGRDEAAWREASAAFLGYH